MEVAVIENQERAFVKRRLRQQLFIQLKTMAAFGSPPGMMRRRVEKKAGVLPHAFAIEDAAFRKPGGRDKLFGAPDEIDRIADGAEARRLRAISTTGKKGFGIRLAGEQRRPANGGGINRPIRVRRFEECVEGLRKPRAIHGSGPQLDPIRAHGIGEAGRIARLRLSSAGGIKVEKSDEKPRGRG